MLTIRRSGPDLRSIAAQIGNVPKTMIPYAAATALTRTAAKLAHESIPDEMRRVFDRPTPWILSGLFSERATKDSLSARVGVRDNYWHGGTPPENILVPEVRGGPRKQKRYEKMLEYRGVLPSGWITVPGQGANLDQYGSIARGQITQILSQTGSFQLAGSSHNMTTGRSAINAQKRAGGRFFVVPPGKRKQPGIYQREFMGSNVTPVLIFGKQKGYPQRLDFERFAAQASGSEFPAQFKIAVNALIAKGWKS